MVTVRCARSSFGYRDWPQALSRSAGRPPDRSYALDGSLCGGQGGLGSAAVGDWGGAGTTEAPPNECRTGSGVEE